MSYWMGVDPGYSGAVAIIEMIMDIKGSFKTRIECIFDMPILIQREKKRVDLNALALRIGVNSNAVKLAVIEEVGVMTGKEGRVGMFNFGYSTGAVTGIIAAHMIPIHQITPSVWKSIMGVTRDKASSRSRASELFPESKSLWSRAKDDGRAEAALLAYLGATHFRSILK